jgi:hypothetical protein
MTEEEWLACDDPDRMLAHLQGGLLERIGTLFGITALSRIGAALTRRKLRLLHCACCHRFCPGIENTPLGQAVRVAERFADGLADSAALRAAQELTHSHTASATGFWVWRACDNTLRVEGLLRLLTGLDLSLMSYCMEATDPRGQPSAVPEHIRESVRQPRSEMAVLIREICGNPFRHYPAPPSWPSSVITLAESMYAGEDCAFALHDALLEAGHPALAEHFCAESWHPKGCWPVDLILGRE